MEQQSTDIVAGWLKESRSAVAFTGAGMSTESGIPDYRSPGGVWMRFQPVFFNEFIASDDARREYWRQKTISQPDFERAQPNLGHQVLAEWERDHAIEGVITQNIDGLHQQAGNNVVWELHGTARQVGCLTCQQRFPALPYVQQFQTTGEVPTCPACGGWLKHATVSFGQSLPPDVLSESARLCQQVDLMLVMGSSLVVEPAASLPRIAHRSGARLVIINRDPTPLDDIADLVLHASLGETLEAINLAYRV
jgi:NAD-dependent deacetylase